MKRILSLLLSICMVLCLAACQNNETEDNTAKLESEKTTAVLIDEYVAHLENGAKSKQNIGKKTTVFGQIVSIKAKSCIVELMSPRSFQVVVSMDTDVLAELNNGEFIAVTGKISSVTLDNSYKIKAQKTEDVSVMDEIFNGYIEELVNRDYWSGYSLQESFDVAFLKDYVSFRENAYLINDDEQLKNYLLGKWEFGKFFKYVHYKNMSEYSFIDTIEFKPDGTCFEDLSSSPDHEGDWSVSNGRLDGYIDGDVYVLSDNIFLTRDWIMIRITGED